MNSWVHRIALLYNKLINWSSNLQSLFLFWMRLTWGPQFFLLGMAKLQQPEQASAILPSSSAYVLGYMVCIGSILLLMGLASRLIALPLIITMLIELKTTYHDTISEWKFLIEPSLVSHEQAYPFLITALLILIFGPGKLSFDGWLKRWIHKKKS